MLSKLKSFTLNSVARLRGKFPFTYLTGSLYHATLNVRIPSKDHFSISSPKQWYADYDWMTLTLEIGLNVATAYIARARNQLL